MVQRRFAFAFVLLCSAANVLHGQHCFYTLRMFAADGNGWGESYVTVGTNYTGVWEDTQFTLESGHMTAVQIPVNIGNVFLVSYTAMGGDQDAIHYEIHLFGTGVFHSLSPPTEGLMFGEQVSCTYPPAAVTDCIGAMWLNLQNSHSWNSASTGFSGFVSDLDPSNQGCLEDGENQGIWYVLDPYTYWEGFYIGPFAFSITPHPNHPADYDFAVWGPFVDVQCPPPGPPLRCSYAAGIGNTGLNAFAEDEQDEDGDGWASPIYFNAGDRYLLYVGRKDNGPLNFTINPSFPTGLDEQTTGANFGLHPNPATERCTLTLPHGSQGTHQVHVHDAAGRRVMHQTLTLATGSRSAELDLHSLQAGAYVVHLRDAQGQAVGSTRLLKH